MFYFKPLYIRPKKTSYLAGLDPENLSIPDLAPVFQNIARCIDHHLLHCENGQPLVIIGGEQHNSPESKMIHIGVMSHIVRLAQDRVFKGEAFIAYEQTETLLWDKAQDILGQDISENKRFQMAQADQKGHLALKSILTNNRAEDAPQSIARFLSYILKANLSCVFNDASLNRYNFDPNDPTLEEALDAVGDNVPKIPHCELDARESYGWALRNHMMVTKAMTTQKSQQASIIYQCCGQNHVFGKSKTGRRYDHSLARLYKNAGANVLPILTAFSQEEDAEIEQDLKPWKDEFPQTIYLSGLINAVFNKYDQEAERAYISLLEDAFSARPCPFSMPDTEPDYERLKSDIRALIT